MTITFRLSLWQLQNTLQYLHQQYQNQSRFEAHRICQRHQYPKSIVHQIHQLRPNDDCTLTFLFLKSVLSKEWHSVLYSNRFPAVQTDCHQNLRHDPLARVLDYELGHNTLIWRNRSQEYLVRFCHFLRSLTNRSHLSQRSILNHYLSKTKNAFHQR